MVGYKIAYVTDGDGDFEVKHPALVILDIPDNAAKITPEDRYVNCEIPPNIYFGFLNWNLQYHAYNWDLQYHAYIKYRRNSDKALFEEYLEKLRKVKFVWAKHKVNPYYYENPIHKSYCKTVEDDFLIVVRFIHASKCRASQAKVIDIIGLMDNEHHTHAKSMFDEDFVYTVGGEVFPSSYMFNSNEFDICGDGIHYFESATLAVLFAIDGIKGGNTGIDVGQIHAKFMIEQLGILLGNRGDCGKRADFYVRDEPYEEGD